MKIPDIQTGVWDAVADQKSFNHPLPIMKLRKLLGPQAQLLDYGCGYGRSCQELSDAGFRNTYGVDISIKLLQRGLSLNPFLCLSLFEGGDLPFHSESFDACVLMAVLNCIPSDKGQHKAVNEILRVLKPGGLLFLSDYPVQKDRRNQQRYRKYENKYNSFGVFQTSDGAVFRHHSRQRINSLFSGFELLERYETRVLTMNGNPAEIFQILARKK